MAWGFATYDIYHCKITGGPTTTRAALLSPLYRLSQLVPLTLDGTAPHIFAQLSHVFCSFHCGHALGRSRGFRTLFLMIIGFPAVQPPKVIHLSSVDECCLWATSLSFIYMRLSNSCNICFIICHHRITCSRRSHKNIMGIHFRFCPLCYHPAS